MSLGMMLPILNEEAYVGFCIESIKHLIDQLVVCDLGCTDKSIDIITDKLANTSVKLKVFTLKEKDDYSFSRNECIKRLNTEWILRLDADEVLAMVDGSPILKSTLDETLRSTFKIGDKEVQPQIFRIFTIHFLYNYFTIDARNNGIHFTIDPLFRKAIFKEYVNKMHEIPTYKTDVYKFDIRNPIIFHFGGCKGPEELRRKYSQGMKIAKEHDIPFKEELTKFKTVSEYLSHHELMRGIRPTMLYYGSLPKVMELW